MLTNLTRDKELHGSPEWALNSWQHTKGFMFSKPRQRAIIFLFMPAKKITLHMWFVFGPIDVLVLDGEGKVLSLKEGFKPWFIWATGFKASAIVELPFGTIEWTGTEVGDMIRLPTPPLK